MNQRLISETAFNMARVLAGRFDQNLGDEELRQRFAECFKTCKAGLEAYCQQDKRIKNHLHPLEKSHESATGK